MNIIQLRPLAIAAFLCISISACDRGGSDLPAVSEANCSAENIAKITDEISRKEFSGRCASRNTYKPSPKKDW